jgi:hypothetical protein
MLKSFWYIYSYFPNSAPVCKLIPISSVYVCVYYIFFWLSEWLLAPLEGMFSTELSSLYDYRIRSTNKWICDETKSSLPIVDIPNLVRNRKVHPRVQNGPSERPILSHINPTFVFTILSLITILIFSGHIRLVSPSGFFHAGISTEILYEFFTSSICGICFHHISLL